MKYAKGDIVYTIGSGFTRGVPRIEKRTITQVKHGGTHVLAGSIFSIDKVFPTLDDAADALAIALEEFQAECVRREQAAADAIEQLEAGTVAVVDLSRSAA